MWNCYYSNIVHKNLIFKLCYLYFCTFNYLFTEALDPLPNNNNVVQWYIWHGAIYDDTFGQWVWLRDGSPVTYFNWLSPANTSSVDGFNLWPYGPEPDYLDWEHNSFLSATHGAGLLNAPGDGSHIAMCEYE